MSKIDTKKIAKKTTDTVKSVGKTVSENPKTFMYGLLALAGAVIIYKGYKKINGIFNPDYSDEVTGVGNGNTYNATITQSQARNYAQQLLDAMNVNRNSWFGGGTDEDTIEAVFDQLKNGDDFLLVFQSFGMKEYNGFNSPFEDLGGLDSYEPRNLVYWLQSEISSIWEPTLYNKIKTRVEQAGFVF